MTLDYVFLLLALLAIPIWLLTANPLWAVILITLVDIFGFGPTLRKAYYYPEQENRNFYLLFFIRCIFVILALETYSLTTILFPSAIGLSCLSMTLMLMFRTDRTAIRKISNRSTTWNLGSESFWNFFRCRSQNLLLQFCHARRPWRADTSAEPVQGCTLFGVSTKEELAITPEHKQKNFKLSRYRYLYLLFFLA